MDKHTLLYLTMGADVYKSLLSLFARSKSFRGLHGWQSVSGHEYRSESGWLSAFRSRKTYCTIPESILNIV